MITVKLLLQNIVFLWIKYLNIFRAESYKEKVTEAGSKSWDCIMKFLNVLVWNYILFYVGRVSEVGVEYGGIFKKDEFIKRNVR